MCVVMCACVYVQMSKPIVDFRSLFPVLSILFTEAGYLRVPKAANLDS